VRSGRAVYEAVMGWVRHDVASRKAWLGEVLGVVQMAMLLIGQKLALINYRLPKVHCNSLTCRMRHHPPHNAVIVENPST
jgi:hypothetical protein